MTTSWKCTICGATAISKCPDQRNIFPSVEPAIWSNILFTDVIHGKNGQREVIMNITDYSSKNDNVPDSQVVLNVLSDMYKSRTAIADAICNHNWVLDSETETQCSLGCTHDNLLSKHIAKKTPKAPLNAPAIINSFYRPIKVLLEQCRIMVNATKSSFDSYAEEQNQQLKYLIGEAIKKYSVGDNILPKYRVHLNYDYHDSRNKVVTFENDDAMKIFVNGLIVQRPYLRTEDVYNPNTHQYETKQTGISITTEVYNNESNRYEEFTLGHTTTCIHCKKEVDLTGDTVNGNSHVECHIKHIARLKVKEHWLNIPVHKTLDELMNTYDHDHVERNITRYLSDIFYGNVEILDARISDRWMYNKKARESHQVIRVRIKSSWYQDQDIKATCINSWIPKTQ
jgi:hypothetical protein